MLRSAFTLAALGGVSLVVAAIGPAEEAPPTAEAPTAPASVDFDLPLFWPFPLPAPDPPPASPALGHPTLIERSGDLLYIVDGPTSDSPGGLRVVDVADPLAESPLGFAGFACDPKDVQAEGQRVFVSCGQDGVREVDVTEPASPSLLSTVATDKTTRAVATDGSLLLVVGTDSLLEVFDVSVPGAPTARGTGVLEGSFAQDVAHHAGHALVATTHGLEVFDLVDPDLPVPGTPLPLPGSVSSIALDGAVAFLRNTYGGLRVVDLADPSAPSLLRSLDPPVAGHLLHRDGERLYQFGNEGVHVYRLGAPSLPVFASSHAHPAPIRGLAILGDQALVADLDFGLQLVSLDEGSCAHAGVPLRFTFVSDPTPERPDNVPFTAEEEQHLRDLLGVGDDGDTCLPLGAYDRLTRVLGPPDLRADELGMPRFVVNFQRRPPSALAGAAAFWDGENVVLLIGADETIEPEDDRKVLHELTHAIATDTFPSHALFLSEGLATAAEHIVGEEYGFTDHDDVFFSRCEGIDVPGIRMDRGSVYNPLLQRERYVASACFLLRLTYAESLGSEPGTYLADLRAAAKTLGEAGLEGAPASAPAIEGAAPSCVEGQASDDWLASQAVYAFAPPVPGLEVYVAPEFGGMTPGASGKAFFFKRHVPPGAQVSRELIPGIPHAGTVDTGAFYDATVEGGYRLFDVYGEPVGAEQPFDVNALGLTGPTYWATPLVDLDAAPCQVDSDGDGVMRCRFRRELRLSVEYDDPTTGETITIERTAESWAYSGPNIGGLRGVARGFETGRVRVFLPGIGVAFDATVEGGAFTLPSEAYVSDAPMALCDLETGPRNACPLDPADVGAIVPDGCPVYSRTDAPSGFFRAYRGPARVARLISGIAGDVVVEPRSYTKLADRMDLVY